LGTKLVSQTRPGVTSRYKIGIRVLLFLLLPSEKEEKELRRERKKERLNLTVRAGPAERALIVVCFFLRLIRGLLLWGIQFLFFLFNLVSSAVERNEVV
jgi:hypothetical protein